VNAQSVHSQCTDSAQSTPIWYDSEPFLIDGKNLQNFTITYKFDPANITRIWKFTN